MDDKRALLNAAGSVLAYHYALGINTYPLCEDLVSFLDRSQAPTVPPAAQKPVSLQKTVRKPALKNKGPELPLAERQNLLRDVSEEVTSCSACELHLERKIPVVGRGCCGARLLIVGDWLVVDEKGSAEGVLLGRAQDLMLEKMLSAIKLSGDQVFISNIIKCGIPPSLQPRAAHVQSCLSYLRRQIALVRPEMICTMGPVSAKALLEIPLSLSRIRKNFHSYQLDDGLTLPVVCTYHPSYLLQNPEMKKATWEDLQMLARKLGTL